jgi:hypothetical protein
MWLRPRGDITKLAQRMYKFDRSVTELLNKVNQLIYKEKFESMYIR